MPAELRHELEVHAVAAGDQRRRQEDGGDHREDLDDLVLLDVDHTERGVEQEVAGSFASHITGDRDRGTAPARFSPVADAPATAASGGARVSATFG
jgi:hypothetical protein